MDDVIEIDLRKIIFSLMKRWKIILIVSFIFGLAAFLYSFLQPDLYQAKAVIAITKPRYIANFDQQYQTVNPGSPSNKALLDIVLGDSIVSMVYDYWQGAEKEKITYNDFLEDAIEADSGSDATMLVLSVKLKNAQEAANLVNYWVKVSVRQINSMYSGADAEQLTFFDQQIIQSQNNLANIQRELTEFESQDMSPLIQNELSSLLATQTGNLRRQRFIQYTLDDVNGLLNSAKNNRNNSALIQNLNQNLSIIQLRFFAISGLEQSDIQYQIDGDLNRSTVSAEDFLMIVNELVQILEKLNQIYEDENNQLGEQVLEYQKQLRDLQNQKLELDTKYKVVNDTYETLQRKQKEVRISSQDPHGDVQVASLANVPQERMSHNIIGNTLIGLLFGGIVAMGYLIFKDWFEGKNSSAES